MLEKLLKYTPLLGTLLIFLGLLKQIIYYTHFGINIVEYLTLAEILTSFLDDLNIIIAFTAIMVLFSIILIVALKRGSGLQEPNFTDEVDSIIYNHKYKYALLFFVIIMALMILVEINVLKLSYIIIYFLLFSIMQFLTFLFGLKKENEKFDISDTSVMLIVGVVLFTSVYLLAKKDISDLKNNSKNVEISFEHGLLKCNKSTGLIYLGKTSEWVFSFDESTHTYFSYPTSKIKYLAISDK